MKVYYLYHRHKSVHVLQNAYLRWFSVSYKPWVSELALTMADKEILLSQTGMLSDKHIDGASLLLSTQFPSIQVLQSSLKLQSRHGFLPVQMASRPRIQSWSIQYVYNVHLWTMGATCQSQTTSKNHCVLLLSQLACSLCQSDTTGSCCVKGNVALYDSASATYLPGSLQIQLIQLYNAVVPPKTDGLLVKCTPVQQQEEQ